MSAHTYRHAQRWSEPGCSARTQHQVKHLHRCGPRIMMEFIRQIKAGAPVDATLEALCSLQPQDYEAVGADLPIERLLEVVKGGRT